MSAYLCNLILYETVFKNVFVKLAHYFFSNFRLRLYYDRNSNLIAQIKYKKCESIETAFENTIRFMIIHQYLIEQESD